MMNRAIICRGSPLARHPALFVRKVRERLGLQPEFAFADPGTPLRTQRSEKLVVGLRAWAMHCRLSDKPWPATRLFGQDFDRQELLDMCRTGPRSSRDLRGDVKLIWEFSRGYSFILCALRAKVGEASAVEGIASEISEWCSYNTDPSGLNWQCAMEVAIRSVNWICSDVLLNGAIRERIGSETWDRYIWNHGRAIWHRLEARRIPSNHYIADLLGLFLVGQTFPYDPLAAKWAAFAFSEMQEAVLAQTYEDGALNEASLPYHALVTEMVLLFCLMAEGALAPAFQGRVAKMCQAVADTMDVDGDIFQVGDNDGGRVIPLDFVSEGFGRGNSILELARVVTGETFTPGKLAMYPRGGWWVGRTSKATVLFEFGGVGLWGQGAHAHNDTLSVNISWGGRKILTDPGSCLYTANSAIRNGFRSTVSHSVVLVDDAEQNQIPQRSPDDLFLLPGPLDGARILASDADGIRAEMSWCPGGKPVVVSRDVRLKDAAVVVRDEVRGKGLAKIAWHFHFHPDVQIREEGNKNSVGLRSGDVTLQLAIPEGLKKTTIPAQYSPVYGQSVASRILRCEATVELPFALTWEIREAAV